MCYALSMDATLEEEPAPPPLQGSKAGRNERRKLLATLANNLCAASLIAAILQPAVTLLRQERPFTAQDFVAMLVFGLVGLIPALLISDARPFAGADGADSVWIVDEEAPGGLAGVEDFLVGVPDEGAEFVLPQVGPDVFHRVQLR